MSPPVPRPEAEMTPKKDQDYIKDLNDLITARQRSLDRTRRSGVRIQRPLWTSDNILFFLSELVVGLYELSDAEGEALALDLSDLVLKRRPDDLHWIKNRVFMTLQSKPADALHFAERALTLERSDHTLYMMSECLRRLKRIDEAAHYGRLALELFEAQGVDDPEYSEILEDLSELDKLSD
jgi:tetratricopeptide (TPR) repeat protein